MAEPEPATARGLRRPPEYLADRGLRRALRGCRRDDDRERSRCASRPRSGRGGGAGPGHLPRPARPRGGGEGCGARATAGRGREKCRRFSGAGWRGPKGCVSSALRAEERDAAARQIDAHTKRSRWMREEAARDGSSCRRSSGRRHQRAEPDRGRAGRGRAGRGRAPRPGRGRAGRGRAGRGDGCRRRFWSSWPEDGDGEVLSRGGSGRSGTRGGLTRRAQPAPKTRAASCQAPGAGVRGGVESGSARTRSARLCIRGGRGGVAGPGHLPEGLGREEAEKVAELARRLRPRRRSHRGRRPLGRLGSGRRCGPRRMRPEPPIWALKLGPGSASASGTEEHDRPHRSAERWQEGVVRRAHVPILRSSQNSGRSSSAETASAVPRRGGAGAWSEPIDVAARRRARRHVPRDSASEHVDALQAGRTGEEARARPRRSRGPRSADRPPLVSGRRSCVGVGCRTTGTWKHEIPRVPGDSGTVTSSPPAATSERDPQPLRGTPPRGRASEVQAPSADRDAQLGHAREPVLLHLSRHAGLLSAGEARGVGVGVGGEGAVDGRRLVGPQAQAHVVVDGLEAGSAGPSGSRSQRSRTASRSFETWCQ